MKINVTTSRTKKVDLSDFLKVAAARLSVGVFDNTPREGGLSNVEIATIQEYGTGKIPARPFLAQGFAKAAPKIRPLLRNLAQKMAKDPKYRPNNDLARIGELYVQTIQGGILAGIPPANAASTVKKKGFDLPLVETGSLLNAIAYKVGDK